MFWFARVGSTSLIAAAVLAGTILHSTPRQPVMSAETRLSSAGMSLAWSDEFNGSAGSEVNRTFWGYDHGPGGWGNNELQTYTMNRENSRLDGAGNLQIRAIKDGDSYTSARLVTRNRVEFQSGLLEVRAKLPEGQGIWPAIWLLGANVAEVGYPASGEIDVMELVNTGTMIHNAIHGPKTGAPDQKWKLSFDFWAGRNLSDDYHVYQVYRSPGVIVIGIDGIPVGVYSRYATPPGSDWVFDAPMYLILNVAVGGDWPGNPNASTAFPATMLVDYVRHWQ
ncbi:MAG: glycoside hydrolase family 16 protein [Actinobacteria bacterium]|nr:glycoside hydrolase family 16 protein [Actinomycetota bacterium]